MEQQNKNEKLIKFVTDEINRQNEMRTQLRENQYKMETHGNTIQITIDGDNENLKYFLDLFLIGDFEKIELWKTEIYKNNKKTTEHTLWVKV